MEKEEEGERIKEEERDSINVSKSLVHLLLCTATLIISTIVCNSL